MTHETCDVLDLLEDLGFQITWTETFEASLRCTVYMLHAVGDEGSQWIIAGDRETEVVDTFIEQLDWEAFDDYARRLSAPTS